MSRSMETTASTTNTRNRRWIHPSTLGDLLDERAQATPDGESLVFPDDRVTFADLAHRADVAAAGLLALGVQPGDRVGLLLPNSVPLVVLLFAAAKIGAVTTPINARFKEREIRHVVTNSGMRVLITASPAADAPNFPALLTETFPEIAEQAGTSLRLVAAPELRHIVLLGDRESPNMLTANAFEAGATRSRAEIDERQRCVRVRDTAVLVYTSGTTSAPKGAMLSHEALTRLADGIAFERFMLTKADRMWVPTALFHGGAITFVITCVSAGCAFVHPGFFDAVSTPRELDRERITVAIPAFETIWLPVLEQQERQQCDLSRIRINVMIGVPERLRELSARLPHAVQVSTVAMTESSAFLSLSKLDDPLDARTTTGGHPMPGMQVRVVDLDTEIDVEPGVVGHLLFRGASSFDGYFRAEQTTAETITEDGWVRSGDLATLDRDGRLTFVSRAKDMMKVGGENVAAAEVEDHLLGHPSVAVVQVVAAPDSYYGEVPAAFVQLKLGHSASESELIDFCRGRIATFRVPRYVRFVAEWPMSGTKVRKIDLRATIATELNELGITEAPRIRSNDPVTR